MTRSASCLSLILIVLSFLLGRESGAGDQPAPIDAKFRRLEAQEIVVWGKDQGAECRIIISGKSVRIVHSSGADATLASKGVWFEQSHKPIISLGAADHRLAVYDERGSVRASLGVEKAPSKSGAADVTELGPALKLLDARGRVVTKLPPE